MLNDLRSAFRQLNRTPGFTAVVVLTLAVGIGACSAIFTVVNSVLLRPLPYHEPDRLVVLTESYLPDFPAFSIAPANFRDWSAQADRFESMYALQDTVSTLATAPEPVRVLAAKVTGGFFQTLGVMPALGRGFGAAEDVPGRNDVAVITHSFWQRQFGGRADIINSTIRLNGRSVTVLGVMPASFEPSGRYEIFLPAGWTAAEAANRGPRLISFAVGRLKPGVTVAEARAQLEGIAAHLATQYPDTNKNWGVTVTGVLDAQTGDMRPVLGTLLAAVGVLLLITCANVANLLLVRASARQRETAVRTALGANRYQLLRHFTMETLLLAGAGGILGIVAAHWGLDALLALAPADLPRAGEITIDGRAVAVTAGLTLLTGLIFGLVPLWSGRGIDLVTALKSGGRAASGGSDRTRVRQGLVVAEMALALVLLAGAGLLIRSFGRLTQAQPGFQPEHALMAWVMTPEEKYNTAAKQTAFAEAVVNRLQTLPGVSATAATPRLPFTEGYCAMQVDVEGRPVPVNERPVTAYYPVTDGYFRAMGIPLLRGREFTPADRTASVAIVSASLSRRIFPGQDPIGRHINVRGQADSWSEIIGIVGDVCPENLTTAEPLPQTYEPLAHQPASSVSFVLRARGDPTALAAQVRRGLIAVDPDQPVYRLEPLTALVRATIARQRFAMLLVAVFAGSALLLAMVGIYSVIAYTVELRQPEFSLRSALGAQSADLHRLVFGWAVRLIGPGLALGLLGAAGATRVLRSQLYQTPTLDAGVFAVVTAVLTTVALAACFLPARRAASIDPAAALRSD